MMKLFSLTAIIILFLSVCIRGPAGEIPLLKVSSNGHSLEQGKDVPFFWLGDTGWLLATKLTREEAARYFRIRSDQGFNVVQVILLHTLDAVNVYGDTALSGRNVARPLVTGGSSFPDSIQYDYWDHVDYLVRLAAENGIYLAMVPVWGSVVRSGAVTREEASEYAGWLAERYKDAPNIIWLNGGDVSGGDSTGIWQAIGHQLDSLDPAHLITFHPFGRTQSSMWFHGESWLDFNMFQSGHRRYDQDDTELSYGEDNWRYAVSDYALLPVKPTIDGEPSYEDIPQGLHDPSQPYWEDRDVRRYAYWSVFSGCFGFTYGHNSVMQFYQPTDAEPAYGARIYWEEALEAPGALQMQHLKNLMLSRSFFDRVPDQSVLVADTGRRYHHQAATRGPDFAMVYTYEGENIAVRLGRIDGERILASWFDPRNGTVSLIGEYPNLGEREFDPPGEVTPGNDWVLLLESQGG